MALNYYVDKDDPAFLIVLLYFLSAGIIGIYHYPLFVWC